MDWTNCTQPFKSREGKSMSEQSKVRYVEKTIPVFSHWFGSWKISLQRQAFSSSELSHRYDRAASKWDRILKRFGYPNAYETLFRDVLSGEAQKFVRVQPCVLDCGVGTGALSSALSRVLPSQFKLDAIDISPSMLEKADRSLRELAWPMLAENRIFLTL